MDAVLMHAATAHVTAGVKVCDPLQSGKGWKPCMVLTLEWCLLAHRGALNIALLDVFVCGHTSNKGSDGERDALVQLSLADGCQPVD